jgi:hypothetical protein
MKVTLLDALQAQLVAVAIETVNSVPLAPTGVIGPSLTVKVQAAVGVWVGDVGDFWLHAAIPIAIPIGNPQVLIATSALTGLPLSGRRRVYSDGPEKEQLQDSDPCLYYPGGADTT